MQIRMIKPFPLINYLLFLSFTFASLFFIQDYLLFALLIILIVFPFISVFFTRYAMKHITVHIPNTIHTTSKNKTSDVTIMVKNPLPIPLPSCQLTFQMSNQFYPNKELFSLSFPLYSRDVRPITLPVTSYYSGNVTVQLKEFSISDILHFLSMKIPLNLSANVIITPDQHLPIFLDESIGSFGEEDIKDNPNKGENLSEVKNIREYQPGDRLQSIHWKLSSKRDTMLVKEYESLSSHQQTVFLELYKDDSYLLDSILDLAYSLSHTLIRLHAEWKMMWWSESNYDFKEVEIHTEDDLFTVFDELFYEETYKNPFYAYEMYMGRESKTHNFIYISKTNPSIWGRELAHTDEGVTALLVSD